MSLVPLVHELLRYAAAPSGPPRNVAVGEPLLAEVATFPRSPAVLTPDAARRPLDGEPEQVAEGVWRLPAFMATDRVGLWRIEIEGVPDLAFSVGLDPAEGDLERISGAELEASHAVWRLRDRAEAGEALDEDDAPRRGELWRWLAALTLAALVLETLWAAWIGVRRRIA
jgi:hypothetical protein